MRAPGWLVEADWLFENLAEQVIFGLIRFDWIGFIWIGFVESGGSLPFKKPGGKLRSASKTQNGPSTTSPGLLLAWMMRSSNATGFCVGVLATRS
jgi:hypothetical protein